MANDKKKKIILIVVLVLVMIAVGMSLNSCSNSVKEDKVVQKKSAKKKSKSQDTTKTEDEKKDESEVKQEEKKEETSKADSSNKSIISESKKDNTVSTTNTSSNKNSASSSTLSSSNSSSNLNSSKLAEHKHDWVAQYKTVNVPEKGHNEQALVQAAYDEQVPITEMREFSICNNCGADITGFASDHILNGTCRRYYSEWREVVTGYNTVHHDAVYESRYVVDSPATTKQELTGYRCSGCGKTRSN